MNTKPAPAAASVVPYRQAHEFPRRILVCVTGMAPQIVTETLYALLKGEPRFVPTEVHIYTTHQGARQASLSLLEPDTDWFGKLLDDFAIPRRQVVFDQDHVHILETPQQDRLEDIRSMEENTAAADQLTRAVATLAEDENCAIHASLAGGRKTLGYYLGYAMSLFGRPQDKLSHVLVSEPFENLPSFFYPPKQGLVLHLRDGTPIHTRDARVDLAEIPFVRLAGRLSKPLHERLHSPEFSFAAAVENAQLALEVPRLEFILDDGLVLVGESRRPLGMSPGDFAFYAFVAEQFKQGTAVSKQGFSVAGLSAMVDRCGVQTRGVTEDGDAELRRKQESRIFDDKYFERRKSAVNRALDAFGLPPDSAYHIAVVPGQHGAYGVGVQVGRIVLNEA